jgi:flagellar biosynthesis/type III secretory pathway ATPase
MDEPIADEVRGILDGHIVLGRAIAARAHYPAIDVTHSISRVMDQVVSPEHARAARSLRGLLAAYEEKRDLVTLGAYAAGSDARLDAAIRALPELEGFLKQDALERAGIDATVAALSELSRRHAAVSARR